MATRSVIGKLNQDGTVTAVYCHWDGYVSNNGRILHEHYQDEAKVDQLLALGDLSSLGEVVGEPHDFSAHYDAGDVRASWCVAYGRDRGESGTAAVQIADVSAFPAWADARANGYAYLFVPGEGWRVYRASGLSHVAPLADALAAIKVD